MSGGAPGAAWRCYYIHHLGDGHVFWEVCDLYISCSHFTAFTLKKNQFKILVIFQFHTKENPFDLFNFLNADELQNCPCVKHFEECLLGAFHIAAAVPGYRETLNLSTSPVSVLDKNVNFVKFWSKIHSYSLCPRAKTCFSSGCFLLSARRGTHKLANTNFCFLPQRLSDTLCPSQTAAARPEARVLLILYGWNGCLRNHPILSLLQPLVFHIQLQGLGRQLGGSECLLLSRKTWVWFPCQTAHNHPKLEV